MVEKEPLLPALFRALQEEKRSKLGTANVLEHPDAKGDQAEINWFKLLDQHLPRRYLVIPKAKAIDCNGKTSQELDITIVDRQYSPFVFHSDARTYVPAESVYAVFECKQGLDRENLLYGAEKVKSVRELHRTSASIVHAGGTYTPRSLTHIVGGLLTTRIDWSTGFGERFRAALTDQVEIGRIDIGCVLSEGGWTVQYAPDGTPEICASMANESVMFFILNLLAELQSIGTVAAMDFSEWKKWVSTREV